MSADEPILYAEDPTWADVTPLEQYEGVTPLAPIFYSEDYKDATDYFRGIVQKGEMSPRVLELTERIIRMNPAHYSAWQYRYKTIMAIDWPLDEERELMDEIAVKHLKTYQVWHHRRLLLTALRSKSSTLEQAKSLRAAYNQELDFIARGLRADAKNYHTWSFRQWVLAQVDDLQMWAGELPWVESLLEEDVRNNSAWHHRFFVVWLSGVHKGEEDRVEVLKREVLFTKEKISISPNNLSAWNYLRGVLDHTRTPYGELRTFVEPYSVAREPGPIDSGDSVDLDNPLPAEAAELPAPAAIEFLAEVLERGGDEEKQRAVALYRSLADRHDTIRKKYWELRMREALVT